MRTHIHVYRHKHAYIRTRTYVHIQIDTALAINDVISCTVIKDLLKNLVYSLCDPLEDGITTFFRNIQVPFTVSWRLIVHQHQFYYFSNMVFNLDVLLCSYNLNFLSFYRVCRIWLQAKVFTRFDFDKSAFRIHRKI